MIGNDHLNQVMELEASRTIAVLRRLISLAAHRDFSNKDMPVFPVKDDSVISNAETVNLGFFAFDSIGKVERVSSGDVMFYLLYDSPLGVYWEFSELTVGVLGKAVAGHFIPNRFSIAFEETRPDLREDLISCQNSGLWYSRYSKKSVQASLSNTTASVLPFLSTRRTTPSNGKGSLDALDGSNDMIFSFTKSLNKGSTIFSSPYGNLRKKVYHSRRDLSIRFERAGLKYTFNNVKSILKWIPAFAGMTWR